MPSSNTLDGDVDVRELVLGTAGEPQNSADPQRVLRAVTKVPRGYLETIILIYSDA